MSFQFSTGLFLLFLLVSSLQHSFMKGWVEVSFTQQRDYLLLMDSRKTALCSKDMGLFKNGNSRIKDKHWSFLLRETQHRLFMLSAQKLAERKMWIGATGNSTPCGLLEDRKRITDYYFKFFFRNSMPHFLAGSPTVRSTSHEFSTWQISLKKVTLPSSSPLLLIFHPSSLSRTFHNTRVHDKTAIFTQLGIFFPTAPSVYLLHGSSEVGKWLRTVGLW